MTTGHPTGHKEPSSPTKVILLAGILAGVLDLTAALITGWLRGTRPVRILHAIASGVLGASSYKAGFKAAALGVALHFVIALGAATVFYIASRRIKFLFDHPVICGLAYGVAVYFFMNLVVLPLSAVTFKVSFTFATLAIGLLVHMFCVGLPISLVTKQFSR